MNLLTTIINKINPGVKKGIGIFISSASTLEVVEYDYHSGVINNYSKISFEYDIISREINVDNFETALQNIIKNFEITPQIPITLTISSILINNKSLPLELDNEEVYTALVSETEKNYIFKKSEPAVSWNITSTDKDNHINNIIYSALQRQLVEKMDMIFRRQNLKLVAVDISYSSFIRGLSVSGIVDDCIKGNLNWSALIIKDNVNAVISLKGSHLLNIEETPLALNSQDTDDLYPSLASSFQDKIRDSKVDTLVIVNYSKIVDSNTLATYFDFKCPIIKIDNNFYKGESLFTYAMDSPFESINLEVIGASCWKNAPVKFGFNFLGSQNSDDTPGFLADLGIAGNPLHSILFILIAIAFLLVTSISLIAMPINASLDNQYRELSAKCTKYKEKFDKPQVKVFNLYDVVQTGFKNNEKLITSFDAISNVIPEKVWITSIAIDADLNASIQGKAYSVEDIVSYYKNLSSVSKLNNFKIKSIRVVGENSDTDQNTPAVSVNTIANNSQPSMPVQPQNTPPSNLPVLPSQPNGTSMLPPPPTSSTSINSLAVISGSKYYEFDFGNPKITQPLDTNQPQTQEKGIISGLTDFSKNLNLGNSTK